MDRSRAHAILCRFWIIQTEWLRNFATIPNGRLDGGQFVCAAIIRQWETENWIAEWWTDERHSIQISSEFIWPNYSDFELIGQNRCLPSKPRPVRYSMAQYPEYCSQSTASQCQSHQAEVGVGRQNEEQLKRPEIKTSSCTTANVQQVDHRLNAGKLKKHFSISAHKLQANFIHLIQCARTVIVPKFTVSALFSVNNLSFGSFWMASTKRTFESFWIEISEC